MRRYIDGQLLYCALCAPQQRAGILVDNSMLDAARMLRARRAPL
ncbi:MAG: hypothetical protein ACR2JQ_08360 [Mycobacteriales bacterium]